MSQASHTRKISPLHWVWEDRWQTLSGISSLRISPVWGIKYKNRPLSRSHFVCSAYLRKEMRKRHEYSLYTIRPSHLYSSLSLKKQESSHICLHNPASSNKPICSDCIFFLQPRQRMRRSLKPPSPRYNASSACRSRFLLTLYGRVGGCCSSLALSWQPSRVLGLLRLPRKASQTQQQQPTTGFAFIKVSPFLHTARPFFPPLHLSFVYKTHDARCSNVSAENAE